MEEYHLAEVGVASSSLARGIMYEQIYLIGGVEYWKIPCRNVFPRGFEPLERHYSRRAEWYDTSVLAIKLDNGRYLIRVKPNAST